MVRNTLGLLALAALLLGGLAWAGGMALTAYMTRPGPAFAAAPVAADASPASESVLDEQWSDTAAWEAYQDKNGDVIPPEEGNIRVSDGSLQVGIVPAADFASQVSKYNNTFLLSRQKLTPTADRKVVAEFTFSVPASFQGSTGLWIEDASIFRYGNMGTGGFTGAFGLNFLSSDSASSGLAGLTFTYVKGWEPQCTIKVDADPTQPARYRIEWSTSGWAAYVNGTLAGTCAINGFQVGEIQLWADNYYLPQIWHLQQINPAAPQHSTYGPIRVWTEPVR